MQRQPAWSARRYAARLPQLDPLGPRPPAGRLLGRVRAPRVCRRARGRRPVAGGRVSALPAAAGRAGAGPAAAGAERLEVRGVLPEGHQAPGWCRRAAATAPGAGAARCRCPALAGPRAPTARPAEPAAAARRHAALELQTGCHPTDAFRRADSPHCLECVSPSSGSTAEQVRGTGGTPTSRAPHLRSTGRRCLSTWNPLVDALSTTSDVHLASHLHSAVVGRHLPMWSRSADRARSQASPGEAVRTAGDSSAAGWLSVTTV